jgi:RNA polymerase sigma-70 factor (ECF subfamily)
VRKYQDAVYGLAFHLVGDFADAQDIAQQTFVTAYLKLSQLKNPGRFAGWINRIAVNESTSWLRQKQRISLLQGRMQHLSYSVPTPHEEYEEKELNAAVMKAMEALSEKNRLAMTLYYIDGLTQREVGSFLGISTTAVENRISRARKQLKEEMMNMVQNTFRENRLTDDFVRKIREALDKADAARRKGNMEEASNYSDEALDALADLPESPQARKLRKEALWIKAEAVRFPLGIEEVLKYHEQAFEIAEKEGDRSEYAGALLVLAYDYSNVGQHEKTAEYRQKALEIYEETGDLAAQGEVWMYRANEALLKDGQEKALEYYQKALDLCNQVEERDYASLCRAAIALIKEVGKSPGIDKLIQFAAWSDVLEKKSGSLTFLHEPGLGRSNRRTCYTWEAAFKISLISMLNVGGKGGEILDYKQRVGEEKTMEDFSHTFKPLIATRTVESDSETVSVMAGKFENCLKLKIVTNTDPNDYGRNKELNRRSCGTRQIWFAPGVGPVKFLFDLVDGFRAHRELAEYHVEGGGDDYFPLSIGNRWIYRWPGMDERYVAKEYYEVAFQKDSKYYIDHYTYAYFSGTEEEYDALV